MSEGYEGLFDLEGKVVLVVGGTGGIGSEIARAAAVLGAKVAVTGRSEKEAAELAAEMGDADRTMGVAVEITDLQSIEEGVSTVESHLGPLNVVVNSAGTHIEQPAEEVAVEAWDEVMNVNLRGAFFLSQAAAQAMLARERGGSIIHITSVRSELGIRRGYAAYCASKGGLANLIKQLATEWAPHGIRVNGIAPTFTRTPLVEKYLSDPDFYEPLVARIPMGRVAETIDLAGLAIFLASDASSFITGQNIFVDGGVTATQ